MRTQRGVIPLHEPGAQMMRLREQERLAEWNAMAGAARDASAARRAASDGGNGVAVSAAGAVPDHEERARADAGSGDGLRPSQVAAPVHALGTRLAERRSVEPRDMAAGQECGEWPRLIPREAWEEARRKADYLWGVWQQEAERAVEEGRPVPPLEQAAILADMEGWGE